MNFFLLYLFGFELYSFENPVTLEGGVRLTLSAPFFDQEVPTISNANVFITDLTNNIIFDFTESETNYFA